MIRVERYQSIHRDIWNEFIRNSKNGTFLFYREYMEYHSDRFVDHSLLFFHENRLAAVFPANDSGENSLVSHGGLTFGGMITDAKMNASQMLDIFSVLRNYALELGLLRIIYKCIPHIYHHLPAEEDLYALFLNQARLYRRDMASTIELANRLSFTKGRRGCIKKALASGIIIRQSSDFEQFMQIDEAHLLSKHNKKPVHTAAELMMLAGKFPKNIHLFGAYLDDVMVGGVVVYESEMVAHAQYIAATPEGKKLGALDAIMNYLLNEFYSKKRYFDFGISTASNGRFLDVNLASNKESFGARAIAYDFYEWTLKDLPLSSI
jgi:hypothetical protein